MTRELLQQEWKQGDEYLPYHPQASHVNPDYRDGWNACYEAALAQPEQPALNNAGIAALNCALEGFAQPVEPVAYRSLQPSGSYTYCSTPQFFNNAEPIYAHPPIAQPEQLAPTWVPLMASDWINIFYTAFAINAHSDEVVKHAVKLTEARLKTLNSTTQPASDQLEKLREIIAATYQIAGAYDAPGHVLDVLANPLLATQEQIDALLPFMPKREDAEPVAMAEASGEIVWIADEYPLNDTPLYLGPPNQRS